jgi:glutamine synthetase type III
MKVTWGKTKSLTNTPLTINGETATTIQEKLNAFADTLEQTFARSSDVDRNFTYSIQQIMNDFLKQSHSRTG